MTSSSSSEGEDLKISALFVIFIVSIVGVIIPLMLAKRFSLQELLTGGLFMTVKCISTGVVLGVSLMHLLPDAIETLESQAEYPLAIAIAAFGIFFTLGVDQVCLYYMNMLGEQSRSEDPLKVHLEPIEDHGCKQQQNLQSHGHNDHEHGNATDTANSVEKGIVVPMQNITTLTPNEAEAGIAGYSRATGRTLEEDKEVYGHSHRHLHVAHDCDELGKSCVTFYLQELE